MDNTSVDDIDTMVDNQPIVHSEQGQEMREHSPRPQPPAPAPQPHTLEPRPLPRSPETHHFSELKHLGLVTPQKPRLAVPTWRESGPAGNTSDVVVDEQLPIQSGGGDSLSDVPLPDVPLPDVALPDDLLHEACPDGSVGEE